jgi:hypothetical protein
MIIHPNQHRFKTFMIKNFSLEAEPTESKEKPQWRLERISAAV